MNFKFCLTAVCLLIVVDTEAQRNLFNQNYQHILTNSKEIKRSEYGSLNGAPTHFIDYVISNLEDSTLSYYISDREQLESHFKLVCKGKKSIIRADSVCLKVRTETLKFSTLKQTRTLLIDDYPDLYDVLNGDEIYISRLDYVPFYGIDPHTINEDSLLVRVKKISMNINNKCIVVPDSVVKRLYYPNLCNKSNIIHPISLFKVPEHDMYYLYIYGMQESSINNKAVIQPTYLAKIIFDDKKFVGSIIVNSLHMSAYKPKGTTNRISF